MPVTRDQIQFDGILGTMPCGKRRFFVTVIGLVSFISFVLFDRVVQGNPIEELESTLPATSEKFSSNTVTINWDKHFGGKNKDYVTSIVQTDDGGYVSAGSKDFYSSDGSSLWIIKLDQSGKLLWERNYKKGLYNSASTIVRTSDGGFLIAGEARLKTSDFWIVKLDASGNMVWDKTYGGPKDEVATSAVQTADGDYVVAGYTWSYGVGTRNAWIVKLDKNGDKKWDRAYGGKQYDFVSSIVQAKDGGYVLAGDTSSYGAGSNDMWVFKIDQNGNKEWDKTFGGTNDDSATSIVQTVDGGYAVGGFTASLKPAGAWLLKLDKSGNKEWDKLLGDDKLQKASAVIKTSDGDYVLSGTSLIDSSSVGWLAKIGKGGTKVWIEFFRRSGDDAINTVIQTTSGSFVIAGQTRSTSDDAWVVKITARNKVRGDSSQADKGEKGPKVAWDKTYGGLPGYEGIEPSYSATVVIQTSDGGYALAGRAEHESTWIMKLNKAGSKQWALEFNNTRGWTDDRERALSLIQTKDNGLVMAGSRRLADHRSSDYWAVKINQNGNKEWEKTYHGNDTSTAYSIVQATDGGYIVSGRTVSLDWKQSEFWVIKLNHKGDKEWDQRLGQSIGNITSPKMMADVAKIPDSIVQTKDGGFVLAGSTYISTASYLGPGSDFWVSKLDRSGNKVWESFYPASNVTAPPKVYVPTDIIQTVDGGYALMGPLKPAGSDKRDYWLVRLSTNGLKEWDYSFDNFGKVESLVQTSDGGYIIAGFKSSTDTGGTLGWAVKLDKSGIKEWDDTFRKSRNNAISSIVQTSDGGYALAGHTASRAWLIKLDSRNK